MVPGTRPALAARCESSRRNRTDRSNRCQIVDVHAEGAPEAAGPYSHATVHNGVLYCAGQVPIDPATGKLVEDGAGAQTTRCLENLEVVCAAAGTTLAKALMVSVFTTDLTKGPEINEAYGADLRRESPPARAMVGVAALPLGSTVEIAAVVAVD